MSDYRRNWTGVTQKELKDLAFWFSDMLGNTLRELLGHLPDRNESVH